MNAGIVVKAETLMPSPAENCCRLGAPEDLALRRREAGSKACPELVESLS
jgi:hypothetical protein